MTVKRLRPLPPPDRLGAVYATPHDHRRWRDHELRVTVTLAAARWLCGPVRSAADLSAGNGWLLDGVQADAKWYGDLAASAAGWLHGPIEETIDQIPGVDLFLCCETLEHLDDPGAVLQRVRAKTRSLVVSTPVGAWHDSNPEHLWAWDRAGVERLLDAAGFRTVAYATSDARATVRHSYEFGVWACR